MIQRSKNRAMRWRTTAILMCFGLVANAAVSALFLSGNIQALSSPTAYAVFQWFPPAIDERLLPLVHIIAQFRGQTAILLGYFALNALVSILLAIGLWKMNRWAAWITTAILMFELTQDVLGVVPIIREGTSVGWLITLGWIPALAWHIVYLLLLWADWIIDRLRIAASFIATFRRERVPLG